MPLWRILDSYARLFDGVLVTFSASRKDFVLIKRKAPLRQENSFSSLGTITNRSHEPCFWKREHILYETTCQLFSKNKLYSMARTASTNSLRVLASHELRLRTLFECLPSGNCCTEPFLSHCALTHRKASLWWGFCCVAAGCVRSEPVLLNTRVPVVHVRTPLSNRVLEKTSLPFGF